MDRLILGRDVYWRTVRGMQEYQFETVKTRQYDMWLRNEYHSS